MSKQPTVPVDPAKSPKRQTLKVCAGNRNVGVISEGPKPPAVPPVNVQIPPSPGKFDRAAAKKLRDSAATSGDVVKKLRLHVDQLIQNEAKAGKSILPMALKPFAHRFDPAVIAALLDSLKSDRFLVGPSADGKSIDVSW